MITTVNNEFISDKIKSFLISPDIVKVRNQLLDGSYHVQSIGNAFITLEIECDVSEGQKTILDTAYVIDKPLRVERDNKYYIGLLQRKPSISIITLSGKTRIYGAQLDIAVSEEGDIE